jgi:hypothetical protein
MQVHAIHAGARILRAGMHWAMRRQNIMLQTRGDLLASTQHSQEPWPCEHRKLSNPTIPTQPRLFEPKLFKPKLPDSGCAGCRPAGCCCPCRRNLSELTHSCACILCAQGAQPLPQLILSMSAQRLICA